MGFKKFSSLTNHYDQKFINKFLENNPMLLTNEKFIVSEKLDGSNFSVFVYPNGEVKFAKRTSFIGDDDFYGCHAVIKNISLTSRLTKVQQFALTQNKTVVLRGELFGEGIQKRIKYGPKNLLFFEINFIEDESCFVCPRYLEEELINMFSLNDLFIEPLAKDLTLEEALMFNHEFDSTILGIENNICEGIVIRPTFQEYFNPVGQRFIIKKKNDKFSEKMKTNKKVKVQKEYEPRVVQARELFLEYLNENRMFSCFSKEGEIQDFSEIGKYIPLIHKDALEDFMNDREHFDFDVFTKEEKKYIFNSSKEIVDLLKNHLMKG